MRLLALDLPDNISDWPEWLERQIVGMQLRDIVQQLEVVQSADVPSGSGTWTEQLNARFTEHMPDLLQRGLAVLDDSQLRELIANPRLLLALQQRVLTDGGAYWDQVPRTQEQNALAAKIAISVSTSADAVQVTPIQAASASRGSHRAKSMSRRWYFAMAATAAALLFAVFLWPRSAEGRFFARQGLLESPKQGPDFLDQIASAVEADWNADSSSDEAFKDKVRALRDSCDVLLKANLKQLDPMVAKDVKDRCATWRATLTDYLQEIESSELTDEVRIRIDETVKKLVRALRGMAVA